MHFKHQSISTEHGYSVYSTHELKNKNGEVIHRLLKVRNPHGSDRSVTPMNDHDPSWTPELRAQVPGYKFGVNDGYLFIPIEDMLIPAAEYTIIMYRDWQVQRTSITKTAKKISMTFTSDVDQMGVITFDFPEDDKLSPSLYVTDKCKGLPINYKVSLLHTNAQGK